MLWINLFIYILFGLAREQARISIQKKQFIMFILMNVNVMLALNKTH